MESHFRLDGQRAVVTGGNKGIGAAISLELAKGGANVISIHRSVAEPAVAAAIKETGHQFAAIHYDLADVTKIPELLKQLLTTYGPVDILVHNAGVQKRHTAQEFPAADWDIVFNVHLKAAFLLAQGLGRQMLKRRRGKIVFISSVAAFSGGYLASAYATAKAGLATLARALANEWAGQGVNVNSVAPGYVETEMVAALTANRILKRQITERIPAGRWGTPQDIAPAVRFLASEAAQYIHGQTLVVDGGWTGLSLTRKKR